MLPARSHLLRNLLIFVSDPSFTQVTDGYFVPLVVWLVCVATKLKIGCFDLHVTCHFCFPYCTQCIHSPKAPIISATYLHCCFLCVISWYMFNEKVYDRVR